jgi:hypothetical protein
MAGLLVRDLRILSDRDAGGVGSGFPGKAPDGIARVGNFRTGMKTHVDRGRGGQRDTRAFGCTDITMNLFLAAHPPARVFRR